MGKDRKVSNQANPKEKPIDWNIVDDLYMAGSTTKEVASYFSFHRQAFADRLFRKYGVSCTEYKQSLMQKGNSLLRKAQFDKAMSGNTQMQIWLGKQRLDQKEPGSLSPEDQQFNKEKDEFLTRLFRSLTDLQERQKENKDLVESHNDPEHEMEDFETF